MYWFLLLISTPMQLVKAVRVLGRNLRKEFLTREDLEAQLRQAGIDDVSVVRAAYLEGDGKLSVLRYDGDPLPPPGQGRRSTWRLIPDWRAHCRLRLPLNMERRI